MMPEKAPQLNLLKLLASFMQAAPRCTCNEPAKVCLLQQLKWRQRNFCTSLRLNPPSAHSAALSLHLPRMSQLPVAFNNAMLYNTISQYVVLTMCIEDIAIIMFKTCPKNVCFFNVLTVSADFHSDFCSKIEASS